MKIKYSFIIPVKEINGYIRESVPEILSIDREDYEIIIYPDRGCSSQDTWPKTRQIESDAGPAVKRSLSLKDAQGDFLVFIDDDAYPRKNILDLLDKDFQNEEIAAVGGPAMTPPSDSFLQKVSGAFFLSFFSGGFPERYAPIGKKRWVQDWPTVNLTVRKETFLKVGRFDSRYWPGEDTKFCLDIVSKLKDRNRILYDPEVIVWHHRREGLMRHLKQIAGYGIHRGYFAKKFPETSLKLKYFMPSLFLLFIIGGASLSLLSKTIFVIYILGWMFYGLALIKVAVDIMRRQKEMKVALYCLIYVFLSHLIYGARFLQGLVFTKELKSKLR